MGSVMWRLSRILNKAGTTHRTFAGAASSSFQQLPAPASVDFIMMHCDRSIGAPSWVLPIARMAKVHGGSDSGFSLLLSRLCVAEAKSGMGHALLSGSLDLPMRQLIAMNTAPRPTHLDLAADEPLVVDTSRRFVRVTERRADGLVAFEFSIGWPELAVDLLLPAAAFAEFCERNQVQRLDV
jgi:phenol hydroxylase P0 protein